MHQTNPERDQATTIVKRQRAALGSMFSDLDMLIPQWKDRTARMLRQFLVEDEIRLLANVQGKTWDEEKSALLRFMNELESGLRDLPGQYLKPSLRTLAAEKAVGAISSNATPSQTANSTSNVFVVHGHDTLAKIDLARTLEKLNLEAIVLHEQEDEGKTIIEKFERDASKVSFAVVLLTPDDIGHPHGKPDTAMPRARQNVVLELGYFCGRLGRSRVCVLHKGNVEIPSDYLGVVYKTMDETGAWRFELARELKRAGLPVNLNDLA